MNEQQKLLIATTNEGKMKEMVDFLGDLPFQLSSLDPVTQALPPDEEEPTIEGNALLKAKYYGEKSGLLTLADDGGLFIQVLGGWPGVRSARIASTDEALCHTALEKMAGVPREKRGAVFRAALACYDPLVQSSFLALGETHGEILTEAVPESTAGFGYDPIFFVPEANKVYAQMTTSEKNAVSHRGKALTKIKYFLQNQYGAKHIVVPVALIIREGKILLALRNDPHRPEFHKRWKVPGGRIELGETIHDNLIREVKEETGFDIAIIQMLPHIQVSPHPNYRYQVYLLPHVCRIIGGNGVARDAEILDMQFFSLDQILTLPLVGRDPEMFQAILPRIKEIIAEHNHLFYA